jgi:hypothetical protein
LGAKELTMAKNPWLDLSWRALELGAEAQAVMTLRMMKLAVGGSAAAAETQLMITEKVEAAAIAQAHLMTSLMTGTGARGPRRALAHYRRKVRANHRRLSKFG